MCMYVFIFVYTHIGYGGKLERENKEYYVGIPETSWQLMRNIL